MLRTAFGAVADAADRFDASKGGRLAAPAALALGRALAAHGSAPRGAPGITPATHPGPPAARARSRSGGAPVGAPWLDGLTPWGARLGPAPALSAWAARAAPGDEAGAVVVSRHGLGGLAPRTLEEIARERRLAPGRVAALLREARARARADALA